MRKIKEVIRLKFEAGLSNERIAAATGQRLALDDLLTTVTRDLASEDHLDDTAIVVIQWGS